MFFFLNGKKFIFNMEKMPKRKMMREREREFILSFYFRYRKTFIFIYILKIISYENFSIESSREEDN